MHYNTKVILFFLLRRFVLAVAAIGIGARFLFGAVHIGQMLVGLAFFLIAAVLLAPPLARLFSEPLGALFWPKRYYDKPQPIYGIPRAKRLRGLPEEALLGYEQIAAEHPHELQPWLDMIDIALTDLHDPERANLLYQRGIAALKNPADRDLLAQVYAATRDRQAPAPVRRIEMPPHAPPRTESPLRPL
jgi:hypothetical protein